MVEFNKINLKEEFLKLYVENATHEQLEQINTLLEQENYEQIESIVEEYIKKISYNKDLKNFDGESGNPIKPEVKEEFSTENMDPQTFELYSILMLIDKYEKEQDKEKKESLHNEIQIARNKYIDSEELTSVRAK